MSSPAKVFVLEVDAADKHLLLEWARSGALPALRSLLATGLVGHTVAPAGFYVGSVWPSFYTGVSPARHGIHSLVQLRPGTYEFVRCPTGDHVKREPFWNALSRAGRRVAVLDVPLSGVSRGLNGLQTVEWGAHDANYGFRTWPPGLARDVLERFGAHPLAGSCNAEGRTPEAFIGLRDALVRGVRRKAELTQWILERDHWDFFIQVFTETHCVGHQCWHFHDSAHPNHDPEVARLTGNPVKDVYVEVDQAIGRLLAAAGDDCTVIVLAGHGMSAKRGAQFLLADILVRLDLAVPAPPTAPGARDRLDSVLAAGWRRVPAPIRRGLQPVRNGVRGWIDGAPRRWSSKLDASRSRCFLVDNGFAVGGIRLNLSGREPSGLVRRGTEADALCAELARDLLDIREVTTGRPVVSRVMLTRDLYGGEHLDDLPDVLVEWSPAVPLGTAGAGRPLNGEMRLVSEKIGVIAGENRYCRTGEHHPDGLFIARGPGIDPGALTRPVSIMDFAPTFCELLGVELPDLDGSPITELLSRRGPREVMAR